MRLALLLASLRLAVAAPAAEEPYYQPTPPVSSEDQKLNQQQEAWVLARSRECAPRSVDWSKRDAPCLAPEPGRPDLNLKNLKKELFWYAVFLESGTFTETADGPQPFSDMKQREISCWSEIKIENFGTTELQRVEIQAYRSDGTMLTVEAPDRVLWPNEKITVRIEDSGPRERGNAWVMIRQSYAKEPKLLVSAKSFFLWQNQLAMQERTAFTNHSDYFDKNRGMVTADGKQRFGVINPTSKPSTVSICYGAVQTYPAATGALLIDLLNAAAGPTIQCQTTEQVHIPPMTVHRVLPQPGYSVYVSVEQQKGWYGGKPRKGERTALSVIVPASTDYSRYEVDSSVTFGAPK